MTRLQLVQNRAARIITDSDFYSTAESLLRALGMLNVRELIKYDTTVMMYKIIYGLSPSYLKGMFHTVDEFHDKPVRNNNINFRYDLMATEAGQRSFSCIGAQVYNSLKESQKTQPSPQSFKTSLKSNEGHSKGELGHDKSGSNMNLKRAFMSQFTQVI